PPPESPTHSVHVPEAFSPTRSANEAGGVAAAPGFGKKSQMPSSWQTTSVLPGSPAPMDSASFAAASSKVNGLVAAISELSPQQPAPSSAGSTKPGRLSRVSTLPSGLTSLVVTSPI